MTVIHGDSLDVLRGMEDNSIDAIVTDPPYGLSFMGKRWDYDVPSVELWEQCLRVLKPGGHLLAFAGTRTQHRMAVRIEDAGFEIRDMIMWVYGSGFPKSMNIAKQIDGKDGRLGWDSPNSGKYGGDGNGMGRPGTKRMPNIHVEIESPVAHQWKGWGSALKPALEPITVARKPLIGTLAANVLQWGTGGLNIDACRVGTEEINTGIPYLYKGDNGNSLGAASERFRVNGGGAKNPSGRWPANVVHDGSEEVVERFPESRGATSNSTGKSTWFAGEPTENTPSYADSGSAARFFYCAKASRRERDAGLDGMPMRSAMRYGEQGQGPEPQQTPRQPVQQRNHHATVKPIALMEWLIKLVTPPGGVVLDPFAGSGTTGCAAARLGVSSILIEREAEYVEIARRRVAYWSAELSPPPDDDV